MRMTTNISMTLELDSTALLDHAVVALGASSDCLPDDFAVIAEAELVGAVADDSAVLETRAGAGAARAVSGRGRHS